MSEFLSSATGALLVATTSFSLIALYLLPGLLARCAFQPYRVWRGEQLGSLALAGFVHANLLHLAVNMWCLWVFGPPLERQIGTPAFALLYGLALVGSHLPTLLKERQNPQYASVGASGAISAVVFAFIVYYPRAELFLLFLPIPIQAWLFGLLYLAYSYYAGRDRTRRINHDAHFWGALVGLAFVAAIDPGAWKWLQL